MTFACSLCDTESMESEYTTNKHMLSEILLQKMRESFARSKEFLDLENTAAGKDHILEQKEEMHHMIRKATPEQLGPDARGAPRRVWRRQYDRSGNNGSSGSARQLVVSCKSIDAMLARGYQFVASLHDVRIIVEVPSRTGSKPRVEADPTGFEPAT